MGRDRTNCANREDLSREPANRLGIDGSVIADNTPLPIPDVSTGAARRVTRPCVSKGILFVGLERPDEFAKARRLVCQGLQALVGQGRDGETATCAPAGQTAASRQ